MSYFEQLADEHQRAVAREARALRSSPGAKQTVTKARRAQAEALNKFMSLRVQESMVVAHNTIKKFSRLGLSMPQELAWLAALQAPQSFTAQGHRVWINGVEVPERFLQGDTAWVAAEVRRVYAPLREATRKEKEQEKARQEAVVKELAAAKKAVAAAKTRLVNAEARLKKAVAACEDLQG